VVILEGNMPVKKISNRLSDAIFDKMNYIFLSISLMIILIPLMNIVSQSISDPFSVLQGKVILFPVKPTLAGYRMIFNNQNILTGFMNSFIIATSGTALSVALTVMAAYPLSRKELFGRNAVMWLFTFTMMFSGGLIPTYLLIQSLGLVDSRLALILPNAVAAFYVIIARTFFTVTIPEALYDASRIDGCSDIRTFVRIVLPLSRPIIAVLTLFYAVGIWNAYFDALIYLQSEDKYPLQLVLRSILVSSEMQAKMLESGSANQAETMAISEVMKYSVIVFSSLPLLLLYPFIQKYFIKGIMIGAIKG
jgi:putative aldouronate transport system permease protein